MSIIREMVRAAWEARENGMPERVRIKFEQRFAEDDAKTTIMVRAALAAAEKRGYVLCPVEPTEEMYAAGEENDGLSWSPEEGEGLDSFNPGVVWAAMLAARPSLEGEDKVMPEAQSKPETDDERLSRAPGVLEAYAKDIEKHGRPLDSGLPSLLRFVAEQIRLRVR